MERIIANPAMQSLMMLTQEDLAEMLNVHVSTVTMLREVGIIPAIKCGRCFMFSQQAVLKFQNDYEGLDVSNLFHATQSKKIVDERRVADVHSN